MKIWNFLEWIIQCHAQNGNIPSLLIAMNCQWGFLKNLKASNSLLQTQLILHLHFPLYEKNKEYSWNICFSILEFPDSRLQHRFKTSTLSSILSVNVDVPPLIYNSPLSEAQVCPFLLGNELGILDTRPVNIFVNQKNNNLTPLWGRLWTGFFPVSNQKNLHLQINKHTHVQCRRFKFSLKALKFMICSEQNFETKLSFYFKSLNVLFLIEIKKRKIEI